MSNRILILGNKPYNNFKFDKIIDSFDIIYRFNMAIPGKNNGTKFGKLAMCNHIYKNFVEDNLSEQELLRKYSGESDASFLSEFYDFFQKNKNKFEKIYHQKESYVHRCNEMLSEYGCDRQFGSIASTGHATIFKLLEQNCNNIYVSGFTIRSDEIRTTTGELKTYTQAKHEGKAGVHCAALESGILAWLHNKNKIDVSLCMVKDTEELSIETNEYETKPSEFIINLLKGN